MISKQWGGAGQKGYLCLCLWSRHGEAQVTAAHTEASGWQALGERTHKHAMVKKAAKCPLSIRHEGRTTDDEEIEVR